MENSTFFARIALDLKLVRPEELGEALRLQEEAAQHGRELLLGQILVERGWLKPEGELVWFEQQLYLAQPGYGSSYLLGKAQFEALLAERARALGPAFRLRAFMDELNASGMIPISLIRDELVTGGERPK